MESQEDSMKDKEKTGRQSCHALPSTQPWLPLQARSADSWAPGGRTL